MPDTFTHSGLSVDVRDHGVTIEADGAALYSWAHRSGAIWPCSDLADLDYLRATFDAHGLVDISEYEGAADEFNAFSSDVLRGVLSADHPAYFVTVGQFA